MSPPRARTKQAVSEVALHRARIAVLGLFFVHGAVYGTWAARIPTIEARLHLSDAALGLVLAGPGIGALIGSQLGGVLIARFGSRIVSSTAPAFLCAPLAAISFANSGWSLFAVLAVMGAGDGSTAVAMSAQSVQIQDQISRPVMNSFHATRSVGAMVGVFAGAASIDANVHLRIALMGTAAVLAVISLLGASSLLPDRPEHQDLHQADRQTRGWIVRSVLWLTGLTFLAALVEDAQASWSGPYLVHIGAAGAVAAAGYGFFSGGEVVGRLAGDRLVQKLGWRVTVRAGALLCAIALLGMLAAGSSVVTLVAMVIIGIGISTVFPGAFAGVGRLPRSAQAFAIGQVNFAGNLGWVLVSPIIGGLTTLVSLPLALIVLPIASVAVALLATAIEPRSSRASS